MQTETFKHSPRDEKPLSSLAYANGLRHPRRTKDWTEAQIVSRGMATADFARQLAEEAQQLVVTQYEREARHLQFANVVEARNFKPFNVPNFDIPISLQRVAQNGEITSGRVFVQGGKLQAQLHSYAGILSFGRQVIINDQVGLIEAAMSLQGSAAARLEAELLYAELEANPLLDDGDPVFSEDHNNIVTGASLSWETVGVATDLLRKQPSNAGNVADLPLRFLVCSSNIEVHAKRAVREAGLEGEVTVIGTGQLPSWRFYGIAPPSWRRPLAYCG